MSKGEGSGGQKTVQSSQYSPEQQEEIKRGLDLYGPTLGQGMNVYGGQRVAGLTPLQGGIFGQLPDFASAFGGLGGQGSLQPQLESTSSQLLQGQMGAQPITPQQETDYFSRAVQNPAMKQFREETLPGVREEFAGPGYWSSARANEGAEAYQDVGDWLGTQRAQLGWDVLGRNQDIQESQASRALGAIGPSLSVQGAPLQQQLGALGGLGGTLELGGAEQQQNQAEITAAMEKFAEENQITDPINLSILMGFLGIPYAGTTGKTTPQTASWKTEDWMQNVVGPAAMSLAGGL